MEHLWSPWRMKYIMQHESSSNCIFCEALNHTDGSDNLIVYRGNKVFVMLNRFPYTGGHLMAVPFSHKPSNEELEIEVLHELMEAVTQAMRVLRTVYKPAGFNIGANIGESAGAGVAYHVHFHIVPRWVGDTNFMTTTGGTRVIPESLEDSYARIKKAWEELK